MPGAWVPQAALPLQLGLHDWQAHLPPLPAQLQARDNPALFSVSAQHLQISGAAWQHYLSTIPSSSIYMTIVILDACRSNGAVNRLAASPAPARQPACYRRHQRGRPGSLLLLAAALHHLLLSVPGQCPAAGRPRLRQQSTVQCSQLWDVQRLACSPLAASMTRRQG
jgi:hypothetical protein